MLADNSIKWHQALPMTAADEIRDALRRRQVVAVVGAGATIAATNGAPEASWYGLLQHGISHCERFGQPRLASSAADQFRELLREGDLDCWLSAATLIETKLAAPHGAEWGRWIHATVGNYALSSRRLLDAIHALECPITTTNYDDLLERSARSVGYVSPTWKEPATIVKIVNRELAGVVHFHGWWRDPASVILGVSSYERVLSSEAAQSIQRAIGQFHSMLFIGYGNGLSDPNFGPLVRFLNGPGSALHRHYVLLTEAEATAATLPPGLTPVVYGAAYDDLPGYLRLLREGYSSHFVPGGKIATLADAGLPSMDAPFVPEVRNIPSGVYQVGDDLLVGSHNALPTRAHTIADAFAIGAFPVTGEEWGAFVDDRGYRYRKRHDPTRRLLPVTGVTFDEAQAYVEWLGDVTGHAYRLPTEAELEAACRGGGSPPAWSSSLSGHYGNYEEAGFARVIPADTFPPNAFGISDTLGNVWEWTVDRWDTARASGSIRPLSGGRTGSDWRVLKGGCYYYLREWAVPAAALGFRSDLVFNSVGFRVVRQIEATVEPGQSYAISSAMADVVLQVDAAHGEIHAVAWTGHQEQHWVVERAPGSIPVRFRNLVTGHYLGVPATPASLENYTAVRPVSATGSNIDWDLVPSDQGYMLRLSGSKLSIDLEGGDLHSNRIILFFSHGNLNQLWCLIKIP